MKLVIHIGLHKTASTTFQNFLHLNRDNLLDAGVLYPKIEEDPSHFEIPSRLLKSDWRFVENFLKDSLKEANTRKINTVFISSEDFETILVEAFRGVQFENLALKVGYSSIHWECVLRSQWEYFNSLYAQLSWDGATLNYSAAGHDIVHFGQMSIGTGTFRWRFAFDYDLFIDKFIQNTTGMFSVISFDSFTDNKTIGKKLIDKVIDSKNASNIFWKSDLLLADKANVRPDDETVEINYLANFLGIKMTEDFFAENEKIFVPIVKYRQSLLDQARKELHNKFIIKFPKISNRLD
jgi:hypothetical protein